MKKADTFARAMAFAGLMALCAWTAQAAYPERPVRIIIPFAAGAGTDVMFRTFAPAIERELGAHFVLENRTGDRKSVVWGKSVSGRVDIGGRGGIKKKTTY